MQVIHTHAAFPGISSGHVSDKKVHVNEIIIFLFCLVAFLFWSHWVYLNVTFETDTSFQTHHFFCIIILYSQNRENYSY